LLAVAHKTPADPEAAAEVADAGANVFEVDVRLIADEVLVTHYLPLIRGFSRLQHDNGRFLWGERHPLAPTLESARSLVPARAEIMLDLKDDRGPAAVRLVDRLIADLPDPGRFHVSAKNWAVLEPLAAAGFRTWRTVHDRRTLAAFERRGLEGAWAVTARKSLLRDDRVLGQVVERAAGQVIVWTVNDVAEAQRLLAAGVLGITTDEADVHRLVAGWARTG
jgi:glycerophosphoryl diester phosphodiesterase